VDARRTLPRSYARFVSISAPSLGSSQGPSGGESESASGSHTGEESTLGTVSPRSWGLLSRCLYLRLLGGTFMASAH
jgi:hypothetical protein